MDNALLADLVLLVHFAFAAFIICGFVLILLGGILHWNWIRNPAFRLVHLGSIVFVALEALVGVSCPLTVWEDALRGIGPDHSGFIARWLGRLLYYHLPAWVFTAAYLALAGLAASLFYILPPRRFGRKSAKPLSC